MSGCVANQRWIVFVFEFVVTIVSWIQKRTIDYMVVLIGGSVNVYLSALMSVSVTERTYDVMKIRHHLLLYHRCYQLVLLLGVGVYHISTYADTTEPISTLSLSTSTSTLREYR